MIDPSPSTGEPIASDPPIGLHARLARPERSADAQSEEEDLYCLVEVSVAPTERQERPAYDIALVIDRSGSMSGENLDQAKGFARFLAERLSPSDRLALIAFADDAETLVPLSPVQGSFAEIVEGLAAVRRSDLFSGWQEGVRALADVTSPGRIRKLLVLTDGRPNIGETESGRLAELARGAIEQHKIESSVIACTTSPRSLVDFANGLADEAAVRWHFFSMEGSSAILASEFDGFATRVASEVSLKLTLEDGVRSRDLLDEDWRKEGAAVRLADLFAGSTDSRVFRLGVTPGHSGELRPLGEVALSCVLDGEPAKSWGVSIPLVLEPRQQSDAVDSAGAKVLREAATSISSAVTSRWDRVQVVGTRKALGSAAERLRTIGTMALPWAEQLEKRIDEIVHMEESARGVAEWCAGAEDQRLTVQGEERGVVGWVSVDRLPAERAQEDTEVGRINGMVAQARTAARIEAAVTGRPCAVHRGSLAESVDELFDKRRHVVAGIDSDVDFVPSAPPPVVVRWWEENRGDISVRCQPHGELARFDTSRSIGMLAPAWNVAVIEYHNRWELTWDDTYDTPEYDGCAVRVEPTSDPGGSNLLEVEEMWIVTVGNVRPWWPYMLVV